MTDPMFAEIDSILKRTFIQVAKEAFVAKQISYEGGWIPAPGDIVTAHVDGQAPFEATYLSTDEPAIEIDGVPHPFYVIDNAGIEWSANALEFVAHDPDFQPVEGEDEEDDLPPIYDRTVALAVAVEAAKDAGLKNLTAAGLLSLARFVAGE